MSTCPITSLRSLGSRLRRGSGRRRMSHPRRRLSWAQALPSYALGVGLVGVYMLLGLAAALAAPGLLGPLTLFSTVAALVLGYGLSRLYSSTGERWALMGAGSVLALVAARPLAALLGLGPGYQALFDMMLLVAAAASLHRVSRLEGLHPGVAAALDRVGGVVALSAFAMLLAVPLVTALAAAVSGAALVSAYLRLSGLAEAARR